MEPPPKKRKFAIEEVRMKFDDPDPKKHDCVLVVDGQKFYCMKATLARHTNYFDAMFFHGFVENNKKEVDLKELLSPDELQIFLETVHGVSCLTDENVEGVLRLAGAWCADIVRNRCIDFLMGEENKKTRKEKFDMSIEINVPKLMELILLEIKGKEEMNEFLTDYDLAKIPQPIVGMIFKKRLELSKPTPPPAVQNVAPPMGWAERRGPEMRDMQRFGEGMLLEIERDRQNRARRDQERRQQNPRRGYNNSPPPRNRAN